MKKISFLILLISLVIAGAWFLSKEPEKPKPMAMGDKDELFVRQIDEKKALTQPLDIKKKVYQKSMHEGSAVFIGPYRVELAIYNHKNQAAIYGVFIDNSLAMPALPKGTKINIKYDQTIISLLPLKNGLLANQGKVPKLPAKFSIFGTLNNKKFSTTLEVSNFREKIINHKVED